MVTGSERAVIGAVRRAVAPAGIRVAAVSGA
jgi:hypothetical protein